MTTADDAIIAGTDSFWETGQYRRTVKRVDDGYFLCKELIQMIKDRCEIETKYAQMLKKHSEDWHKKLDSGKFECSALHQDPTISRLQQSLRLAE